ncbi:MULTISPECIES: DUF3108 domain-containing protein [Maritimibacter]|uniref:DUF3108 domain-containing protein n=1 Tax=Maritimibacter TaxID=404235 RepID=UPI000322BBEF|nr:MULTISPECIES: DUF3108 domain-containing protein [Maritimibacter]MBL6427066.1 DUF3108 domain-containing protein [Maritimibacter sp.]TYP82347.1 uncharacterized protein DUF3108 [Maritimibacter alkaliphilus HTCC2654]
MDWRALALAALVAGPLPAAAADQFQIKLRGITIGTLTVDHSRDADRFDFRSQFHTSGVAGVVKKVQFIMQSRGLLSGHLPIPRSYGERMDTGQRVSNAAITFPSGDRRWDPNTAMVYALSPRPREAGCALDRRLFDGERTNDLSLVEVARTASTITCTGSMTRVAGYSAEELEKRRHDLRLTYTARGDAYVLTEVRTQTVYGDVTITPR